MISEDAIVELSQRSVIKKLAKPQNWDEPIKAIKQMASGKAPGENRIP